MGREVWVRGTARSEGWREVTERKAKKRSEMEEALMSVDEVDWLQAV